MLAFEEKYYCAIKYLVKNSYKEFEKLIQKKSKEFIIKNYWQSYEVNEIEKLL